MDPNTFFLLRRNGTNDHVEQPRSVPLVLMPFEGS